ncbi:hypothetical protein ROHU_001301 [Labeo rohita]|uniref:Uncharacterized protein n=1 Tax=Labeo rohita TaxID=84645 RepID=A0A498P0Y1_LABRO|nr:hypothetical protein ROHU_001301 [Labeo rohita]
MCNTHALHTDKRRKSFKANFKYVEPVPICLGKNESGKESFAQYIPIKQSLEALFCCKSVIEQHKNSRSTIKTNDVLSDVWDGSNVDDNVLLKDDTDSLALILYEDAFEVANPLGSGKKKHKILAVYMTLGNLLPYCQSGIDHMQLVLLCKEQDFKFFGQDLVFATLVQDLKDLEENGVLLADGKVHKDIRTKWPYLFAQRHIYGHFEMLTDKKVLRLLESSIQESGPKIVQFFKEKPTNEDVRNTLSSDQNDVAAMVLQLLLAHFKEKLDGLILLTDEFATPSDVQQALPLPESPRLIILGQSLSNQRLMLSVEGQVVCEGEQPNIVSGLAALFASFYNFNLQYQKEAACSLEFIQRRFLDINPERGSKAKKGKVTSKKTGQIVQKKNTTVHPQVSSLLRKLTDFEWNF